MNSLPIFNDVSKDRLFYDRYNYCMSANVRESGCLRKLDHDAIDHVVAVRREWVSRLDDYYRSNRIITDEVVNNLHSICDVLINTKHQYKLVVGYNQIRVYTNDLELFDEITEKVPFIFPYYTKVVIDRPRNTIRLNGSAYSNRTYLRSITVTEKQKRSIGKFLTGQDDIRLSPALKDWLADDTHWRTWSESYYFVDHNDSAWMTMLSLIYPNIIKNTIQIVKS